MRDIRGDLQGRAERLRAELAARIAAAEAAETFIRKSFGTGR